MLHGKQRPTVPSKSAQGLRRIDQRQGKSKAWGEVTDYVSVFPRIARCGVVAWHFVDDKLKAVAFLSTELTEVPQILEVLSPCTLIVEPYREGKWEANSIPVPPGVAVWFARPTWRDDAISVPKQSYVGRLSPLVHRAFSLGFAALFRYGGKTLSGKFTLEEINPTWLSKYGRN